LGSKQVCKDFKVFLGVSNKKKVENSFLEFQNSNPNILITKEQPQRMTYHLCKIKEKNLNG
jgi:hypothetical protein